MGRDRDQGPRSSDPVFNRAQEEARVAAAARAEKNRRQIARNKRRDEITNQTLADTDRIRSAVAEEARRAEIADEVRRLEDLQRQIRAEEDHAEKLRRQNQR